MIFKNEKVYLHFNYDTIGATKSGLIVSYSKHKNGIVLKMQENHNGYLRFRTSQKGKIVNYRSHRFVYECITGKEIPKGLEINHIDRNKKNNAFDNLEICNRSENVRHAFMNRRRGSTKASKTYNFESQININGNVYHIGTYKTEKEAQDAYFEVYKEWYGVNAW